MEEIGPASSEYMFMKPQSVAVGRTAFDSELKDFTRGVFWVSFLCRWILLLVAGGWRSRQLLWMDSSQSNGFLSAGEGSKAISPWSSGRSNCSFAALFADLERVSLQVEDLLLDDVGGTTYEVAVFGFPPLDTQVRNPLPFQIWHGRPKFRTWRPKHHVPCIFKSDLLVHDGFPVDAVWVFGAMGEMAFDVAELGFQICFWLVRGMIRPLKMFCFGLCSSNANRFLAPGVLPLLVVALYLRLEMNAWARSISA